MVVYRDENQWVHANAHIHRPVTEQWLNSASLGCMHMKLQKTDRGRSELVPGVRTLGQRERTFLLLVDGQRSIREIEGVLRGDVVSIGAKLMEEGYVEELPPLRAASARLHSVVSPSEKTIAKTAAPVASQPVVNGSDQFEGKRSLATTRMFLFDISERIFARKAPGMADQFRQALRDAKDRDSMLAVSREMLEEVERVAGASRADSISERLAMLLPTEVR